MTGRRDNSGSPQRWDPSCRQIVGYFREIDIIKKSPPTSEDRTYGIGLHVFFDFIL